MKNKQYPQSGRLRVNMGNIHCEQGEYPKGIKQYRMAVDQIPATGKELHYKIYRNIGNAFVRLGQYPDAINAYENIMATPEAPDIQTAFNLILCYYATGETEKLKHGFLQMLKVRVTVAAAPAGTLPAILLLFQLHLPYYHACPATIITATPTTTTTTTSYSLACLRSGFGAWATSRRRRRTRR